MFNLHSNLFDNWCFYKIFHFLIINNFLYEKERWNN